MVKAGLEKEKEESLLQDGLKKLVTEISGQNSENLMKLVDSLKDRKEETVCRVRIAKLTIPAKVPSWTRYLTLET